MEIDDQRRWDAKYRGRLGHGNAQPDAFVMQALDALGPGDGRRALDLACGTGRHGLELARRGWQVSAWDVSGVGLALLDQRARQGGLTLETRRLDALSLEVVPEPFELLLCTDFLDRPLWQRLASWIRPGGHVLLATFRTDWPGPKPPMRFRLQPGELRQGLPGLRVLQVEEGAGRAGLLAHRTEQANLG